MMSCEERVNYKIEKRLINESRHKRDVQICLLINNKLDTCFSLYLKSDTNFKTLRLKYADLKSELVYADQVLYPIDSNMVQLNTKLDISIYNNLLMKIKKSGIRLSKKEQQQLLLKSNILLDEQNSFNVYFYPGEVAYKKIDSIFKYHFIRSKDSTNYFNDESGWIWNDLFVLRTIGYILLNPNKHEFIIFSRKNYVDYMFIAYNLDKNGFLTHLELLNPTTVLTPISNH